MDWHRVMLQVWVGERHTGSGNLSGREYAARQRCEYSRTKGGCSSGKSFYLG